MLSRAFRTFAKTANKPFPAIQGKNKQLKTFLLRDIFFLFFLLIFLIIN